MLAFSRLVVLFTAELSPLAAATVMESTPGPTLSEASAKLSTMQVPFVPSASLLLLRASTRASCHDSEMST